MEHSRKQVAPLYQKIKDHILNKIASGAWQPAERVPSENELVKEFDVSRMTTNRALKELTSEGYLVRVAGVGTFVADLHAQSHPLEIHNIAEEIRGRGHQHSAQVLSLDQLPATDSVAAQLNMAIGEPVFHSVILHLEQHIPIQIEDRFVNAAVAPDYGAQDFTCITPYDYLMRIAPLQKAEHVVKAILPKADVRDALQMTADEPCLLIKRRTWTRGKVASSAMLYHPGSRYELSGRFRP
ncbi:histidine utilization repressor [Paremcibacter congregatus]|uniref:Histidine utilization repressor n=1 Tax=Paremcibacter congregatus TaxID=2043170 RepID=A0A2G4YP08_9PROT|nr:histidine utilization repressor [Paremcibacter congregatus]PHZ84062.1 histidine utilization repressor [Paremcibacter congregatus]QDE25877.1 histidine utilization repressor [Paremcibacter congregatus]